MSDALLPWYDRELEHFRQMAGEFAERYPKIAARLNLDAQGAKDPHVERMVQAFAYLNARIRYKLDDDFPEIADAMLGVLYPHYLAPVPSLSMLQFQLKKGQADLPRGHLVPAGTPLESEAVDGEKCQFRTCYPVRLWPFELVSATLQSRPFAAPATPRSGQAQGLLRLQLELSDKALGFRDFDPGTLRFHLHAPQFQHASRLYELLLNGTLELAVAAAPDDPDPVVLPRGRLAAVGFDRGDALLPSSARSFPGYRMLTEFFAFPRKFLFFEVAGLDRAALRNVGRTLYLYAYLRKSDADLERLVSTEMVRTGCTPVVNLFPQPADPFELSHRQSEYRVVADARREAAVEVYSIDQVRVADPDGEARDFQPFYSTSHTASRAHEGAYWHATRRPGPVTAEGSGSGGSEMYLTFVDLGFNPLTRAGETVQAQTTCFNRDLPARLPFGGGRPRFAFRAGDEKLAQPVCLTQPTSTYRPQFRKGNLWRLISHLSLNHLSIEGGPAGAEALREILALYDVVSTDDTHDTIAGIASIQRRPSVARVGGPASGFCRGVDLELTLDPEKFTGGSPYLFACVLERFLGLYVTINSFTRLTVRRKRTHGQGETWTWPPRAGERVLL